MANSPRSFTISLQPWTHDVHKLQPSRIRIGLLIVVHGVVCAQLFALFSYFQSAIPLFFLPVVLCSAIYYWFIEPSRYPDHLLFDGVYWQICFQSDEQGSVESSLSRLLQMYQLDRFRLMLNRWIQPRPSHIVRSTLIQESSAVFRYCALLSFRSVSGERYTVDIWFDQLPADQFRRLRVIARFW